jgi:hypothetical protein
MIFQARHQKWGTAGQLHEGDELGE